MILFSRQNLVEGLPLDSVEYGSPKNTILRQIPYKDLKLWSDLTTSPGIFGTIDSKPGLDVFNLMISCSFFIVFRRNFQIAQFRKT